jgi:hypothetical protein
MLMTENVNEQDIDLLDFDSEPQRKTYCSYMSYQNFSSDEPTYQINNSPWYLKWEKGKPAFFLRMENVFRQMPVDCFLLTAQRSSQHDLSNFKEQVENYFNLTLEEVLCQTEASVTMN